MANMVLINGVNLSASSVNILWGGNLLTGVTKIDWSVDQDKANNYSLAQDPSSRGYGQKKYAGTMEMFKDQWIAICYGAPNGRPLSIKPSNLVITYGDENVPFTSETLQAMEWAKDMGSASAGETMLTVSIPFIFAGEPIRK